MKKKKLFIFHDKTQRNSRTKIKEKGAKPKKRHAVQKIKDEHKEKKKNHERAKNKVEGKKTFHVFEMSSRIGTYAAKSP